MHKMHITGCVCQAMSCQTAYTAQLDKRKQRKSSHSHKDSLKLTDMIYPILHKGTVNILKPFIEQLSSWQTLASPPILSLQIKLRQLGYVCTQMTYKIISMTPINARGCDSKRRTHRVSTLTRMPPKLNGNTQIGQLTLANVTALPLPPCKLASHSPINVKSD